MGLLRRRNVIIGLIFIVIAWANARWVVPSPSAPVLGAAACVSCHKAICDSHAVTAHFRTSSLASASTIKGHFKGRVVFNDRLEVILEKKGGKFFQTALFNGALYESEAFDVVIGSGRKGQSYLYWDSVRLFQLPISYFTPLDSWCNSPGYPTNLVYFNKLVPERCMGCHATRAKVLESGFDKKSIEYGIGCERCHGGGEAHVAWHTAHPGEKEGKEMVRIGTLGRQQRLDACAACHSGTSNVDTSSTMDVHGNQYGLLTRSKCFRASEMDCSSCHNVHRDEWGKEEVFSQRCMNCHASHGCSFGPVKEGGLVNNCVDCHMPALPSQKILMQFSGTTKPVHDLVRTHRIGIYPDISKEYLKRSGGPGH